MTTSKDTQLINLLKTSRGQLEGIIRMIEEDRYCVDVSKQILAVQAQLKKANLKILHTHLRSYLKSSDVCENSFEKIMFTIEQYTK